LVKREVQISNGLPRFHTTLEAGKNKCYIMLDASKNTCYIVLDASKNTCYIMLDASKNTCYVMLEASKNICNVTDKWILKEIYTWSPALGPSVLKRIGLQRLSSFIKLEFWK